MTKQTVKETIRICKDKNILKEYLMSKEVEVITIMMSLFDNEQIIRTYLKDAANAAANTAAYEADRATAERMIKDGEMSLEKIARYVPSLSMDELRKLEAEVMQLA